MVASSRRVTIVLFSRRLETNPVRLDLDCAARAGGHHYE